MSRLVPVLLAVLLALPAPGIAAVGDAPAATDAVDTVDAAAADAAAQAEPPENTSRLLQLDEVQASNFTQPEASLATELSMQGSEMDGRFEEQVVKRRLTSLEGEEQLEYAFVKTAYLQEEIDEMVELERAARRSYNSGSISAAEYVRTLARLDSRASAMREPFQHLFEYYRSQSDSGIKRPIGELQAKLVMFEGPVRQRVGDVTRGDATGSDVYVSSSEDGVVLSTVEDDTFIREALRTDNVREDTPLHGYSDAMAALQDQYPWAVPDELARGGPLGLSAWEWERSHEHVRFSTYFYGNVTDPYREIQRKSLSDYPFNSSEQTFSGNLSLTVNRTYAGGPLEVALTNQTGAPLDGEVRINGSEIGRTGDDGLVWALQPEGSFTVVAVHEGDRIELELEPTTARFTG